MNLFIPTEGSPKEISPQEGEVFTLEELQGFVGGIIEVVYTQHNPKGARENYLLIVDEEGLLKDKPFNPAATILAGKEIVGDAVAIKESAIR